ncbi:MAG: hypothetical protein KIT09_05950 [Bryobacteraceae bacterium]|nr:hypothetical protein [Bryobacteraceae bacterium]
MTAVGLTLCHLVIALIVAVVAYAVREVRRRRMAVRPRRPDLTMDEAWGLATAPGAFSPDAGLIRPPMPDEVRAEAERVTREAEQFSLGADNPRLAIRQAILGNATLALQLAAIAEHDEAARQALVQGYEPGMDDLLRLAAASREWAWFTLRVYARWKFDDAVADDWFHNYVRVARPYIREKVRLAKEHVMRMDSSAGRFAEIYDALLAQLQANMAKARPKERFVRPDLPWN